ncbi:MAG: hypothetical protein ACR2MB_08825 [Acidimicrobiales bacterium]
MTGTGPLVAADELLNHQIADTFAVVAESDRAWTEKVCATAYARDGSLQLAFGLGTYVNRGVSDAYAGVCRGDEQWTVRSSSARSPSTDRISIGPIHYEVLDPMEAVRFRLEANDIVPVSFEWTFRRVAPAALEHREQHRSLGGARVDADVVRYHQTGTADGWVDVDGERIDLTTASWVSTRDHSWGVRYQVGAPVTDAAPPERISGFASFSLWMPALLERADGSQVAMHVYLQRRTGDGRTSVEAQGAMEHADATLEPFVSIDADLQFQDDNRRLLGGVLHTRSGDGTERHFVVEAPSDTGFHLGAGLYFGFEGRHHGQWQGPLEVTGEHVTDCGDPTVARRLHQHRDCVVHLHEEAAGLRGWGNAQTIVIGAHPEMGCTRAASFI